MKIDLDWIKKELDAGREVELECVDESGFVAHDNYSSSSTNKQILCDADLRVVNIRLKTIYFNCGRSIIESMLKYFRIKRNEPTFDDLIDVAVQAQKDGLIHKVEIISRRSIYVSEKPISKSAHFNLTSIEAGISFINSLYTETFVIESVEDTLKIDTSGSEIIKVILANNEVLSSNYLDCLCDISDGFRFKILKGATVTQKRGK